jgi:serine/threonine-protein kinase RsbW
MQVKRVAAEMGFLPGDLEDIELAVGEAVSNAILYGSPRMGDSVSISSYLDCVSCRFSVEVRDQGPGFDPETVVLEVGMDSLHGRGLFLMRHLMDEVHLQRLADGMLVEVAKQMPPSQGC